MLYFNNIWRNTYLKNTRLTSGNASIPTCTYLDLISIQNGFSTMLSCNFTVFQRCNVHIPERIAWTPPIGNTFRSDVASSQHSWPQGTLRPWPHRLRWRSSGSSNKCLKHLPGCPYREVKFFFLQVVTFWGCYQAFR